MVSSPEKTKSFSPHRAPHSLTLQEICWRTVRDHITTSNVLDLIRYAQQLNMPMDMEAHCMRYVTSAYIVLRERRSMADLSEVLEPQLLEKLEAAVLEAERLAMARKSVLGRVVETPPPPDSTALQEPSVVGHHVSYLYVALVSGVSWPEGINPEAREEHLCHKEFCQVFGMSHEQYAALPAWKRLVLKQDHRLF